MISRTIGKSLLKKMVVLNKRINSVSKTPLTSSKASANMSKDVIASVIDSGLFDRSWAARGRVGLTDEALVAGYINQAFDLSGPNVIFDDEYYLTTYSDVRAAGVPPLLHYLRWGSAEGRKPGPLFDVDYYVSQCADAYTHRAGPLGHYLEVGRQRNIGPNALFDPSWYKKTYPDVGEMDPLEHFVLFGASEMRDPSALFSTKYYLTRHPSIIGSEVNPLSHCLSSHGQEDERYFYSPISGEATPLLPPGWAHLARYDVLKYRFGSVANFRSGRPLIVFGTHEMSRTGAPLIILNLMKAFSELDAYEIITCADRLGPLENEFRRYSHIVDLSRHNINDKDLNFSDLIFEFGIDVRLAICNTANLNHIAGPLKAFGVPVISLVHEMLYVYPKQYVKELYNFSDRVIFPAQFVRDVANDRVPLPSGKGLVLGQGLLDPSFGKGDREAARKAIRREFGLSDDSRIVLGCGTINIRKGVDLFISMARFVRERSEDDVHFLWMGSDSADPSYAYWSKKDVHTSGLSDIVHFIGERSNPEPYYLGSDLFTMTSREDPFPCVLHEAMACGLPTVAFDEAGGAPEALENCGIIVPYRDTSRMGDEVLRLLQDHVARSQLQADAMTRVATKYRFADYAREIMRIAAEDIGAEIDVPSLESSESRKPLVLFFARDWWISGVNSFTETLARYLIENDVDVRLVFPTLNKQNVKHLPDLPRIEMNLEGDVVEQWARINDLIESNAPCIVIPNYDYETSALTPTWGNNVGSIGIIHSDDIEHYDHLHRLGRYWNAVICSNQHLRDEAIDINPSFASKTRVIPYGVSVPKSTIPLQTRQSQQPIRLVYCGRITQHQKRVRDLIEIVKHLKREATPFTLKVIGEGDQFDELKSAWADDILDGRIQMLGRLRREETYDVYRGSDILLLVSQFEGMPIALIEAMACGCLPVVSDIPSGIPDLVNELTGYRIPIGDTKAFAEVIEHLRTHPEILQQKRSASVDHILNGGFTTPAMGKAYKDVILSIWSEITSGSYKRPPSLSWKAPLEGASLPGYLFHLGRRD